MAARGTLSSTSPSSYSILAVPSRWTVAIMPSYQNLPPMYNAFTRSPITKSAASAAACTALEGALEDEVFNSPSPCSSSESSSSVPTRSSNLSSSAAASSVKSVGSTENKSRPVRPRTCLPLCSWLFALLSLPLCAAALASCLAFSQASSLSNVTGVRVVSRARCHSIRASSSWGSGVSSSTFFSFFTSPSFGFLGFFTAS
mmetsp:Transcript_39868/g.66154  ORF Transcript_39868/g.66154 Transcript_39868/m.66154 type:complete len:201 (+) Transcript_39868:663-1265(+)